MPFPTITSLDFFIVTPVGVSEKQKGVRTVRWLGSQHSQGRHRLRQPNTPLHRANHVAYLGHAQGDARLVPAMVEMDVFGEIWL
ncbi:MAG: hypothetical protein KKG12_09525 [Gammaproteobacteria bacterium]|nr:hypothetical protein [Gammaproteobacteria bacterium]